MDCCQCQGIEGFFNEREAAHSLKRYHRDGPARSTRVLLDALRATRVEGATLLDIGGGVGAIPLDLLSAGVTSATDVDASSAYIAAARTEAARQGFDDRMTYQHGNFVALAPTIAPADIVTLDRVICCYHDVQALVQTSASKARRLYGLVYPRDSWLSGMLSLFANAFFRLRKNPFRIFAHRTRTIESLLRTAGLERRFQRNVGLWRVAIYVRP